MWVSICGSRCHIFQTWISLGDKAKISMRGKNEFVCVPADMCLGEVVSIIFFLFILLLTVCAALGEIHTQTQCVNLLIYFPHKDSTSTNLMHTHSQNVLTHSTKPPTNQQRLLL